ncbi:hypothetical protein ACK8HX_01770 [Oryzobacter sp. R7]|uniref:hypothetical protein n=1 Tax=Oryzobacter faecalis TaxID=3388656 RepID=UPI00398D43E1
MAQRDGGVGRRVVLTAAVVAAISPATGCGIRLEDDAPRVPLVPTRTPLAAEDALVALTRDCLALASAAEGLPGELGAELAALHRRQHTVLRTTLVRRQVPPADLDAGPSPTGSASGTPSGSGTPAGSATPTASPSSERSPSAAPSPSSSPDPQETRTALAAAEAAAAAAAGTLAGVDADLRATVAALHAQRYAAATLLAGRPPDVPADPVTGEAVVGLVARTEAATWFLEVVVARSAGAQRQRADVSLAALRALRGDLVAGGSRAEAAIGHPLPFPVATAADAARLAREVLTTLRTDLGAVLDPLVSAHGALGLAAATRWLGTVEVEAHRWGVDLAPFPGLA